MNRKSEAPADQRAVDAIAEKLLAAGIRPTVQLIHEALGGSPRGLRQMLEDWQYRLARRVPVVDAPATALPEERAEVIVRQAIDSARGTLRARLRSTRQRLAALEPHSGELHAQGDLDHLERELLDLQSQIRGFARQLAELAAGLTPLEKKVSELIRAVRLQGVSPRARKDKGRSRD
jgi:hypothetical protein